MKKMQRKSACR